NRPQGWLAPSLMHRVLTTETWVKRLCKFAPIEEIRQELVRFDTQALYILKLADANTSEVLYWVMKYVSIYWRNGEENARIAVQKMCRYRLSISTLKLKAGLIASLICA
ncbi:MAG: RRXRR domain-containing protein, partial [Imperialibacter sp.]|uniref:RRXRR domain-containing protein n=1 Tax=Imperialibacter sp. TaxID=2038411 RepID=UPI0032F07A8D